MCALGDAFQAIVEFEPIAIWVTEFCVEISLGEAFVLRRLKKEREMRHGRASDKESGACERELRRAERVA